MKRIALSMLLATVALLASADETQKGKVQDTLDDKSAKQTQQSSSGGTVQDTLNDSDNRTNNASTGTTGTSGSGTSATANANASFTSVSNLFTPVWSVPKKPTSPSSTRQPNHRPTTKTPQKITMPTPQQPVTIQNHIHMPATASNGTAMTWSTKNPNMDGVVKFDPNALPEGNGNMTVSLGADGTAYMHRDSGNSMNIWPFIFLLLGILAVLALVAMIRNAANGNGNHYHNYPYPPQPGAAPQPANNQGGAAHQAAPFGQGANGAGPGNDVPPRPSWAPVTINVYGNAAVQPQPNIANPGP